MTTNQDEVREEWNKYYDEQTGLLPDETCRDYADWWLQKFDTILAKKRETLREVMEGNEMAQEEIDQYLSILS